MDTEKASPSLDENISSEAITGTKIQGTEKEGKKTSPGIVYLSRIPPFMQPQKVRHLLSHFGTIGRVYLQPEDALIHKRRKKFRGNKKRNYTEGWIEFMDKRVAKAIALALNNTPIGGKKRSYYHDDLWNMKYLSKFKWTHLTEKIAYENAVRDQRLRTEISQTKKENTHYLQSVEKSKEIEAIVTRKRKAGLEKESMKKSYKQQKVIDDSDKTGASSSQLKDSLLTKILPGIS